MCQVDLYDIEDIRTFELGLLVSCPLPGDPNPYDCQLHVLRLRPLQEREKWLDSLSAEDCIRHYLKHKACYAEKSAMMGVY